MVGGKWFLTALAVLSLSAPQILAAQAPERGLDAAAQEVEPEEIQQLARLQAELNVLRSEYRQRLGTTHESHAKREIQDRMQRSVAELLDRHGMTQVEYERRLFLISTDAERLQLFERFLGEAARGGAAP
jgi:uncharacterized protein YlxW (UPF0749 family)